MAQVTERKDEKIVKTKVGTSIYSSSSSTEETYQKHKEQFKQLLNVFPSTTSTYQILHRLSHVAQGSELAVTAFPKKKTITTTKKKRKRRKLHKTNEFNQKPNGTKHKPSCKLSPKPILPPPPKVVKKNIQIIDKSDGKRIGVIVCSPVGNVPVVLAQMRLNRVGLGGKGGKNWSRTNVVTIGDCKDTEFQYLPYLPLWWAEIDPETGKELVKD